MPDDFGVGIGKERECVTLFLTMALSHVGRINTDRGHADTAFFKLAKPLLKTPQLGVAKRSPVAAIEDQEHAARFEGVRSPGCQQIPERHRFAILIRQCEVRRLLTQMGGGV